MARVLIVDDEEAVARAIALLLELHDMDSVAACDPESALQILDREPVALVIQDMNFSPGATSGEEGVVLFESIRRRHPGVPVLLITAFASLETAVRLIKDGAEDYLEKPWDDDRLLATVRNLLRLRRLEQENTRLLDERRRARDELAERYDLCGLVYASDSMHEVVSLAVRVARSDVPVLITGVSGTGKEKLAEVIQANSDRRRRPHVRVNCGGLPESLLEAELFGAEAGAYTGATKQRLGRFEAADGGTLLLDEIGNLPAAGQARLLRVLQTGEFERLGSSTTRRVDVRVIAATNTDLQQEIAAGRFREDLYFRLNVIEIRLPPLTERRDDILPLAEHMLLEQAPSPDGVHRRLSLASREALLGYHWPGNVRQLGNCIQRAVLVAQGAEIEPDDLGLELEGSQPGCSGPRTTPLKTPEEAERHQIEEALLLHGGVVSRAADELGLSRQALYRRMEKLGIVLERRLR